MAPDLAADLDAAARIDPLQHVVDALAARDDLSTATVLVVHGDRAEPRATAGHLDRRGSAHEGVDVARLRLLDVPGSSTAPGSAPQPLVVALSHVDGVLRAALVLDTSVAEAPSGQPLPTAIGQALSAVRTALDRERLSEEAFVAGAARQVLRAASNELSTSELLARSRRALLDGFGASGMWWRLFGPPGSAPDEGFFRDAADGRPAADTPPELAVLADETARRAWAAREVLVVRQGLPLPASLTADAATRALVETFLRRSDIGAIMLVPLGAGERCLGLAVLHRSGGPDWTRAEAEEVRLVGHDLGRAVLNARTHERELELVRRLQAVDEYKSRLISTVSHELRTPLTSVVGNLELISDLLDEQPHDPVLARAAEATARGAQRLVDLVEDLLMLSRVADPDAAPYRRRVDVRELLAEVVALHAAVAAEVDIDIVVAAAPRPAVVLGDPAQLDRVLVNLVSNAVKYSPPGSTVELAVGGDDQHVEVVCADHGLGISPGDQDHLFGEFFRSDDPGVRAVSGTGLGLAIVQRVVSQHQGRIELDSELGIGSTFRVLLPRAGG